MAIVGRVIFSMVSRTIWFGPKTLFPAWWAAIGRQVDEAPDGSPRTWILILVSSLVQAVFLAVLINGLATPGGSTTVLSGATTGFLVWIGMVAPTALVNKLFPGLLKAWLLEQGLHLINLVAFGAILGAWR